MIPWNPLKKTRQETPEGRRSMDALVDEWRTGESTQAERLSPGARHRIVSEALRPTSARRAMPALSSPFLPFSRWALGAAVPAVILAVVLGIWAEPRRQGGLAVADADTRIQVSKEGGEVVFLIANGKPSHQVYKSDAPYGFRSSSPQQTRDGRYRDGLDGGPELVFYRIE